MVNEKMPCPIYWISVEPEAVIELPCLGRTERITLWRCGLCGEWHGLWPQHEGDEFQEIMNDGWSGDEGEEYAPPGADAAIPFRNL